MEFNDKLDVTLDEVEGYGIGISQERSRKSALQGSDELERFIREFERHILYNAIFNLKPIEECMSLIAKDIYRILGFLKKESNAVIVLTDKTNRFKLVELDKYNR